MNNLHHFNSIKVRLKPYNMQAQGAQQLFQFHKGTIKTCLLNAALPR